MPSGLPFVVKQSKCFKTRGLCWRPVSSFRKALCLGMGLFLEFPFTGRSQPEPFQQSREPALRTPSTGFPERVRGTGRTQARAPLAAPAPAPPAPAFPTIPCDAAAAGPGPGWRQSGGVRGPSGAVRKVSNAPSCSPAAGFGHFRPDALRQVPQSLVGNGCPPAGGAEDPARPARRAAGGESGFWEPEFRAGGGGVSSLNWKPVGLLAAAAGTRSSRGRWPGRGSG